MYTRHIRKYVCMRTCIYIYILCYILNYIYYILYIHIIYYIIYILYIYIKYTYMYIYVYMYVCCWYFGWLFPLDQSFLLRSIARLPYGLPYVYFIYSVSSPIPPIFPSLAPSSFFDFSFASSLETAYPIGHRTRNVQCFVYFSHRNSAWTHMIDRFGIPNLHPAARGPLLSKRYQIYHRF